MKCDHLRAQEILAIWETAGNRDWLLALVVDHGRSAPDAVGVTIFLDLKPNGI